ncbi:MAG: hypothetical protein H8D78_14015 [Chloroflexi bacterium]|nr:hypothetical protein [Chloroflexota bacterium]
METIQIQLPPTLVRQMRQELSADEVPSWVIAEAIQLWLGRQQKVKAEKTKTLRILRQAGVVMTSERQRASAEAMMDTLSLKEVPPRAQVEAVLARLRVPLSTEIIAMRGER